MNSSLVNDYFVVADVDGTLGLSDDDVILRMVVDPSNAEKIAYSPSLLSAIDFDTDGISFTITETPNTGKAGHQLYSLYGKDAKAYVALKNLGGGSGDFEYEIKETGNGIGHFLGI